MDLDLVDRRLLYEWFGLRLVRDDLRTAGGEHFEYTYVDHPGSVVVVPRLASGELVLVEQFRYTLRERSLEFPAGALEPPEDAAATARRELLEETSLTAGEIVQLGRTAPSNGFSSEWTTIFLADSLSGTPHAHTATSARETHSIVVLREHEVVARIGRGEITDGTTLSALLLLLIARSR